MLRETILLIALTNLNFPAIFGTDTPIKDTSNTLSKAIKHENTNFDFPNTDSSQNRARQSFRGLKHQVLRSYSLVQFDIKPVRPATTLYIYNDGKTRVFLQPPYKSMKELDLEKASQILGKSYFDYEDNDDNTSGYFTFHFFTAGPIEPNIYHIDVRFSDTDKKIVSYRVRGLEIIKPEWQLD